MADCGVNWLYLIMTHLLRPLLRFSMKTLDFLASFGSWLFSIIDFFYSSWSQASSATLSDY